MMESGIFWDVEKLPRVSIFDIEFGYTKVRRNNGKDKEDKE